MALKDLLNMTKTDRYTADGRDKINELQAKVTEDVTYKPGDISQKTGLQKQPDGSWAPPKKGGLGSGTGKKETGNKEQKRQKHIAANAQHQFEAASETANSEIDLANLKSIKSFMDEEHATFKNALYSKAETLARRGARGTPDPENEKSLLKFAEAAGMADDLKLYLKEEVNSKYEFGGGESKPAESRHDQLVNEYWQSIRKAKNAPVSRVAAELERGTFDDDVRETMGDGQSMEDLARSLISPAFEEEGYIPQDKLDQARRFVLKRYKALESDATDSAPRILTGDTKIRIRK